MKNFLSRKRANANHSSSSTAVPSQSNSIDHGLPAGNVNGDRNVQSMENGHKEKYDPSAHPAPSITMRTIVMAISVAMGGFIFGYDTGQISGFLEMNVFLQMFGEKTTVSDEHPSGYYFTNVRSGLIVALVWLLLPYSRCSANCSSSRSVL